MSGRRNVLVVGKLDATTFEFLIKLYYWIPNNMLKNILTIILWYRTNVEWECKYLGNIKYIKEVIIMAKEDNKRDFRENFKEKSKESFKDNRKNNFEVIDHYINYSDIQIPYEIVRSKRKTLSIVISVGGKVTVKIPLRATKSDVTRLLENKRDWIYNTYKKQATKQRKGIEVKEGAIIPYLDRTFRLHIVFNPSKYAANISVVEGVQYMQEIEDLLVVETPLTEPNFITECLESWYKKNAKNIITMRVEQYSKVMGVTYGRITIRSQKSRWGSCSSIGNLNFNWHLVMMPSKILDYVVIHELAHRIEMNHSKQFWEIVSEFCPEYKLRKLWLKEHGLSYELYTKV